MQFSVGGTKPAMARGRYTQGNQIVRQQQQQRRANDKQWSSAQNFKASMQVNSRKPAMNSMPGMNSHQVVLSGNNNFRQPRQKQFLKPQRQQHPATMQQQAMQQQGMQQAVQQQAMEHQQKLEMELQVRMQQQHQQEMQQQAAQQADAPNYYTHEPKGCKRAKFWTPEVEKNYRYQNAGYRDEHEYCQAHGPPKLNKHGWPSKTCLKKNGFFSYWGTDRECEDKYVARVKLYTY